MMATSSGADACKQRQIPLLQRFLHYGVVRVRKDVADNLKRRVEREAIFHQQAGQLRNRHDRVRVIQLHGVLLGEPRVIIAVTLLVGAQHILQGRTDQHILLLDAHLLALAAVVVGVKELGDVLRLVLVGGCLRVMLIVEGGEVDFVQGFGLPQAQRADVLRAIADNRHVVGDSQHVAGLHFHDDRLVDAADAPRVAEAAPIVRLFVLIAVDKRLLEQTVAVAQPVAGQRDVRRDRGIKEASCQTPQTAVAESIVLNVFQNRDVNAFFRQQCLHVVQQPKAEQVVVHHAADEVFCRQIVRLPMPLPFRFALDPGGGERVHGGGGQGIVQLCRGGFRKGDVVVLQQQRFGLPKQFLGVHHVALSFIFVD